MLSVLRFVHYGAVVAGKGIAAIVPALPERHADQILPVFAQRAVGTMQKQTQGETIMTEPALTQAEVRAIAELARLELSDEDVVRYQKQLSDILAYFQKLEELDTSHIDPTSSVLPLTSVMRPDVAGPPLTVDEVVANAPASDGEQFLVRAVLGDGG